MKTIEETSKKHSLNVYNGFDKDETFKLEECIKQSEYDFKKGIEFAQQWINAELDLPKNSDPVLGRYEQCAPEVCNYFDSIKEWVDSVSGDIITVTHWRPIEFK